MAARRAVVLDFDGTLCDSMRNHAESYRRVLAPHGVSPTDRQVFLLEGARSETIIAECLRSAHKDADGETVRRLAEEKQRVFRSLGPAPLYPGAEALVRHLREEVDHLGLVTGTRRENLDLMIPTLVPLFDAILAQDAYTHDKPHPEPYAKAAAALRLDPQRCAAVENAVRGVQSARAADYGFVLGITTTLTVGDLAAAEADVVVSDHGQALSALRRWLVDGSVAG